MNLFSTVLAQNTGAINLQTQSSTGGFTFASFTVLGLINGAITLLLSIAGLLFFFMLVLGGIRWILSGGDKSSTEQARSQITAALIGLVVVFSAWAIATLLSQVFGINFLQFTLPDFTV